MTILWIVLTILGLVTAGVSGAWVSTSVRAGEIGAWASWAVGQVSIIVWALQARAHTMSLVSASVLFDVVYTTAWFATYYWLGQSITLVQVAGIACLLLGMTLVNL